MRTLFDVMSTPQLGSLKDKHSCRIILLKLLNSNQKTNDFYAEKGKEPSDYKGARTVC